MGQIDLKATKLSVQVDHGSVISDRSLSIRLSLLEPQLFFRHDGSNLQLERWFLLVQEGGEEPDEDRLNLPDTIGSLKRMLRDVASASISLPTSRFEQVLESAHSSLALGTVSLEVEGLEETDSGFVWTEPEEKLAITSVCFEFTRIASASEA